MILWLLLKLQSWTVRTESCASIALETLLPFKTDFITAASAPLESWIIGELPEWLENNPRLTSRWHADATVIPEIFLLDLNSISVMAMPLSPEEQFEICTKVAPAVQLAKAICDILTPDDLQQHNYWVQKCQHIHVDWWKDAFKRPCNIILISLFLNSYLMWKHIKSRRRYVESIWGTGMYFSNIRMVSQGAMRLGIDNCDVRGQLVYKFEVNSVHIIKSNWYVVKKWTLITNIYYQSLLPQGALDSLLQSNHKNDNSFWLLIVIKEVHKRNGATAYMIIKNDSRFHCHFNDHGPPLKDGHLPALLASILQYLVYIFWTSYCKAPEMYLLKIKNNSRTWTLEHHLRRARIGYTKCHWMLDGCGVLGLDTQYVK